MKISKLVSALVILLFFQQGFAQTAKRFTIDGSITGAHVDSVLFYYQDAAGNYAHIEQLVLNGRFTLSGYIAQPGSSRIMFKSKGEVISRFEQQYRTRELYIEPVALKLTGDAINLKTLKLTGSETDDVYKELEAKTTAIREEMKPLEVAFMKEKDHEKAAVIHDQFEPYKARIKKITYRFFLDHPNSYATLNMMRYYVSNMSLDSAKRIYNAFNEKLKATDGAKEIEKNIKQSEAGSPGAIAPLFTKTDINGKRLSLADFKGRYVMLDFWASWCVPCRKSNPHMIELYNKYKGRGFDIIGIADDDGRMETWNTAVVKDGVGIWHNVLRGLKMDMIMKHIQNPDDLDQQYGVASIPTKILIDPAGKIIGRYGDSYGGTEEDMDKMLASVFDK